MSSKKTKTYKDLPGGNPEVSVIIPAYNAEKYIDESVESILGQTFQDLELIILDDGSTDQTSKKIQKLAEKDKRIIFLKNEKNLGIPKTRNKGISIAKGKYIAWQDADDISVPDRIEKQKAFLDENPQAGIVGGFLEFFEEGKKPSLRKYAATDEAIRKNIFKYSPVAQPASMIRKECFDRIGLYNTELEAAEDLEMSFRIGNAYKFANLQDTMIRYRVHSGNITSNKLLTLEKNTLKIRRSYANGYNYKMSLTDKIYNILQQISMHILPTSAKIYLFNLFRNSK